MPPVIALIGAPGAGKGTQARLLRDKVGVPHISTGDMFRAVKREGTALAKELRNIMSSGRLLPHELVMQVVRERTEQHDCVKGYILDGFPRTTEQARMLEALTIQQHHKIRAILIEVPAELLERRVGGRLLCPLCGEIYNIYFRQSRRANLCDRHPEVELTRREEDQPNKLRRRLTDFEELTLPVIDYYERSYRLKRVDGTLEPNALHTVIARYVFSISEP